MKMVELKATLEGGTRVTLSTAQTKPVITLRKSGGDQREPDPYFSCSVEEWGEIRTAVRELILMVGADGDRVPRPMPSEAVHPSETR